MIKTVLSFNSYVKTYQKTNHTQNVVCGMFQKFSHS